MQRSLLCLLWGLIRILKIQGFSFINITQEVPAHHLGRRTLVGMVTGSYGRAPAEIRNAKQEQRYKGYMYRGVPHNQSRRFICKRTPAMPLSVKPLSQLSLRNVRGSVTLSSPCQGSACCLCVLQIKPSFEEEGRK